MSGRKRTKRKNSDEDFDVDEGDDVLDIDEINRWACHSCTVVNRAAAFRCFVCGTRKGTSTRRSRCDDNVVEMQKSITTMVQKQVEKEKSLKRKERSNVKSSTTQELSEGTTTSETKKEELDQRMGKLDSPTLEEAFLLANTLDFVGLLPKPKPSEDSGFESQDSAPVLLQKPHTPKKSSSDPDKKKRDYIKKKMPKLSRESTPSVNERRSETTAPVPPQLKTAGSSPKVANPQIMVAPQPERFQEEVPNSTQSSIPQEVAMPKTPQTVNTVSNMGSTVVSTESFVAPSTTVPSASSSTPITPTANCVPLTEIPKDLFIKNLPESIAKQLNLPTNFDLLKLQKQLSGINPVVPEPEPVVQHHDWVRQRGITQGLTSSLGSTQTVSPTTSRQSSETDSSSSDGNRSFDTPHTDTSTTFTKCCQIPDYMIHRDTPQKFVIVANGFPAYFEEFPRRIH